MPQNFTFLKKILDLVSHKIYDLDHCEIYTHLSSVCVLSWISRLYDLVNSRAQNLQMYCFLGLLWGPRPLYCWCIDIDEYLFAVAPLDLKKSKSGIVLKVFLIHYNGWSDISITLDFLLDFKDTCYHSLKSIQFQIDVWFLPCFIVSV